MAVYRIVPAPAFEREVDALRKKFRRIDGDLKKFYEAELSVDPRRCGTKIPGVPAAWKARVGLPSARISKRDGLRLIYLIGDAMHAVILIMVYYKKERADVARAELVRAIETAIPILERKMIERGADPKIVRDWFRSE